jgi:hypothetical protein
MAGCAVTPSAARLNGEVLLPPPTSAAEIEKITATRDDRGGALPDYSIDLLADGTAMRHEPGPGASRTWSAPLDTIAFQRLARRVLDDSLFTWSSHQEMRRSGAILIVIVWMTGHRFKEIEGRAGPHWPLGQTVDSIAATLQWTERTN